MRSKRRPAREAVKILIAEDSPTQAEQLRQLLEENDYKVTVAENGKKALAAARTQKPDLVISDIVMPEMDGYALCKEINSRKELGDVPVILLTSLSAPQDVLMGLQCGANSFIRKPYDGQYLLSRIEYMITNKGLRKSQKTQMVLEIYLGGQKHLITSEKQQILDMLIATSEETVLLNEDLKTREKQLTRSYQSLNALYHISEGLNQGTSEKEVAEKSLERAMELPDVQAGWFLIREGETDFRVAAAQGLPPGLRGPGALDGECMCRRQVLAGEVGQPVNIRECERLSGKNAGMNGLSYHASVPIWSGNRILGVLNLVGAEKGMISEEGLRILHGVGNQVGVAIERARLYEHLEKMVDERTVALRAEIVVRRKAEDEVRANLERIRALHEIDVAITSTMDLQAILNILLDKISLLLPNSATVVRLKNRNTGELQRVASRNIDEDAYGSQRRKTDLGFTSKSIRDRVPIFIPNVQTDPRVSHPDFYRDQGLVSYLLVPLIAKDEAVGVLSFFSKGEQEFSEEEVEFAETLAGQGAIAIHNAQLYEQLVKSNSVKDGFLSIMSHELRTPLNVVMGYTAMIKDGLLGEVNPQQAEALQKVIDQANDQLAMINNVLYATVLEVQKPGLDTQEMSPADVLDQLRSDYDARLQPEGLTIQWEYPRDLPLMRTDGTKLRLVLQNLIGNAIKFTGKGVVTVSAAVSQNGRSGEWAEFKVADTGVGISKEQLPFIFQKFHQVDSSQTRTFGGVGMGLYIVKRFTELLGGTVTVESEPGKGSTFTVRIPAE